MKIVQYKIEDLIDLTLNLGCKRKIRLAKILALLIDVFLSLSLALTLTLAIRVALGLEGGAKEEWKVEFTSPPPEPIPCDTCGQGGRASFSTFAVGDSTKKCFVEAEKTEIDALQSLLIGLSDGTGKQPEVKTAIGGNDVTVLNVDDGSEIPLVTFLDGIELLHLKPRLTRLRVWDNHKELRVSYHE